MNRDLEQEAARVAGEMVPPETMVRGFMSFPTDPPPESVLAGNAWLRVGDVHFFNSSAGAGKSVAFIQASMAWALGLPFLGITPSRPLKILHFVGEDDESTLGQCREGFLEHSLATTGKQLKASDLAELDKMVRTEFSRQYTGSGFLVRLDQLLTDEAADLVLINPLLSYIGGNIVEEASVFLRDGIMPTMQKHRAASLIAHHTCKLSKASWEEMDFTYSGIGGGEVANVPRSILTLAPTKAKGLHCLYVSKRPTTGWKDDDGSFTDHLYIRRTDNPSRPAWLPVSHEEAAELMEGSAPEQARTKKVTPQDVVDAVATGAMTRQSLLEKLQRERKCSEKPAKDAIRDARADEIVETFTRPNPNGGKAIVWFCLPEHLEQFTKG